MELKSFIHLCRFYIEHVQSFAEIASPLTNLLRKDSKFMLGLKETRVWNLLKDQTLKASQLAFFNPIFQDKVYTDASDIVKVGQGEEEVGWMDQQRESSGWG